MSDNKKFYYLKLKENFFDTPEMVVLESQQDGFLYSNILIKLCLKAMKSDGRLMVNERIPYNANMIATVTRHQVGTVEKALRLFESLGLIEVISADEIYIADMQSMIGHTTTEAIRKSKYRELVNDRKLISSSGTLSEIRPPEIELDLELKKKKKICYTPQLDDYSIAYFDIYRQVTGKNHRQIKKHIEWCITIEDMSIDEFTDIAYEHIVNEQNKDRQYIEYFNKTLERLR